jgi:hypothetical protein
MRLGTGGGSSWTRRPDGCKRWRDARPPISEENKDGPVRRKASKSTRESAASDPDAECAADRRVNPGRGSHTSRRPTGTFGPGAWFAPRPRRGAENRLIRRSCVV